VFELSVSDSLAGWSPHRRPRRETPPPLILRLTNTEIEFQKDPIESERERGEFRDGGRITPPPPRSHQITRAALRLLVFIEDAGMRKTSLVVTITSFGLSLPLVFARLDFGL